PAHRLRQCGAHRQERAQEGADPEAVRPRAEAPELRAVRRVGAAGEDDRAERGRGRDAAAPAADGAPGESGREIPTAAEGEAAREAEGAPEAGGAAEGPAGPPSTLAAQNSFRLSSRIVTGPWFTRTTSIIARKTPVSTRSPDCRRRET